VTSLKLAYYADDFTGATDAMEALTIAGIDTVLFTSVPTSSELAENYPQLEAIGVASLTRSAPLHELDREIPRAFERLRDLDPKIVHYKVCSTFDSSPDVGSIGRVADLGIRILKPDYVPVLAGAPELGRYVVFANLFASDGTKVHRLDRHETMRDHPVTPMTEGDLRRHLGAQTERQIGHVDITTVKRGATAVRDSVQEQVRLGAELIILDTLDTEDLSTLGRHMWNSTNGEGIGFVIGSSGVEGALTSHWQTSGEVLPPASSSFRMQPVDQILVLSASAALKTAQQVEWAREAGWATIPIDCGQLIDDSATIASARDLIDEARRAFQSGRSVVLFTALGPQDPSLEATRERAAELGYNPAARGIEIGRRLGRLLAQLVHELRPKRVCIAGGDTSGHVITEMNVTSLKMIATTVPGAPLCKVAAADPVLGSLELVLKGGQTGPPSFFETVRSGPDR